VAADISKLLNLPARVQRVREAADRAGWRLPTWLVPRPLTLGLIGPVDSGKTAFLRAMLDLKERQLSCLLERPGRDTMRRVEYIHGPQMGVLLYQEDHARPIPFDPDGSGIWQTPGLKRVRVTLPAPILKDWGLVLVDLPSADPQDERYARPFDRVADRDVAFLYVIPGRGITGEDLEVLDSLHRRNHPFLVVESIREEELHPARSAFQLVQRPDLSRVFPYPISLVPFRRTQDGRRAQGVKERQTLKYCVALLRMASLEPSWIERLSRDLQALRSGLCTASEIRLEGIQKSAGNDPSLRQGLEAVSDLLQLQADLTEYRALDQALAGLATCSQNSQAIHVHLVAKRLKTATESLHKAYNIRAGARPEEDASGEGTASEGFCDRFLEARRALTNSIENIQKDDTLALNKAERKAIDSLRQTVSSDTLELALLGCFSSGKSALTNALLGVAIADDRSTLLPTSAGTETATVNLVEHAAERRLNKVTWLTEVRLTFLEPTAEKGTLRIHREEIQAFRMWLQTREVDPLLCTFECAPLNRLDGQQRSLQKSITPFRNLLDLLDSLTRDKQFLYVEEAVEGRRVSSRSIAWAVEVPQFQNPSPLWPRDTDLDQAFSLVKRHPEVALRIKTLHVGFNHPLLKHLSIIDTPGTDATVAHHRRVAHEIIRDKKCPVIYCYNGTRVGARADEQNLLSLRDWGIGRADDNRFFFAVTRQGCVAAEDHQEVLDRVQYTLAELGVREPSLYFTEVVRERNQDFLKLRADLGGFVEQMRGPRYWNWLDRLEHWLEGLRARHERELAATRESAKERESRKKVLGDQLQAAEELLGELKNSQDWGQDWALQRLNQEFSRRLGTMDGLIDQLTNQEAFEVIKDDLREVFAEINSQGVDFLNSTCRAIHSRLKSLVGVRLSSPGLKITRTLGRGRLDPELDEELFAAASTLEAASQVDWGGLLRRIWNFFVGPSEELIQANRERIRARWRQSQNKGTWTMKQVIDEYVKTLAEDLELLREGIEKELGSLSQGPSRELERELEDRIQSASKWLVRLSALRSEYGTEEAAP